MNLGTRRRWSMRNLRLKTPPFLAHMIARRRKFHALRPTLLFFLGILKKKKKKKKNRTKTREVSGFDRILVGGVLDLCLVEKEGEMIYLYEAWNFVRVERGFVGGGVWWGNTAVRAINQPGYILFYIFLLLLFIFYPKLLFYPCFSFNYKFSLLILKFAFMSFNFCLMNF